jgi:ectoine hydroxylase-related dioxygenase (phytanoyl-CoA dioxygenase family)
MNGFKRALTQDEIDTFRRDGVLYLKGVIDPAGVERMRAACDRVMAAPTPMGADLTPSGKTGKFYGDYFVWRQDPDFRALAFDSPLPDLATQLMGAHRVNLIWDHLLVKEPGTDVHSVWHHDQPYSWVDGAQNCSFWVSLDHVTPDSGAVEYIKGSHRWNKWYEAVSFNPGRDFGSGEFEPMPDIESQRADHDIVCFDTAPGDVVVQHLLTIHHAPGNLSDRRRRAIAVRYAGDDATFAFRKKGPRPPVDPGLKPGDPLGGDVFPVVRTA